MKPFIISATILFVLFCPLAVLAQPQPDPKGLVPKGVSTEKWLQELRNANAGKWNEVTLMTGPLRLMSDQAVKGLPPYINDKGTACQRAAANLGFSAASQNYVKGSFDEMGLEAAKALKELAESLSPPTTLRKLIAEALKKGAEELIKYVLKQLSKEKAEVHITETTRSNCKMVLVSIWNKSSSTYELIMYGECKCSSQKCFTPRDTVKMDSFEIRISGKVIIDFDEKKESLMMKPDAPTSITIKCDECKAANNVSGQNSKPPIEPVTIPKPEPPKPPVPVSVDPCKVPPPCPACKIHYDKIAVDCEDIKEIDRQQKNISAQLKPREERVKAGKELKNDKADIEGLNERSAEFTKDKARLRTKIENETAAMKQCEKTQCNKTVTGPPIGGFDPCLIGAWRSVTVTSDFNHWNNGGEGVVLMIDGTGKAVIDYSKAATNTNEGRSRIWRGTASGRLATNKGNLNVTGVEQEATTITFVNPDGTSNTGNLKGQLGNLLQAPITYGYTCDAFTLSLKSVIFSSTFRRAGIQ